MAKIMSEKEIRDWEKQQAKGNFSYVLEQSFIWTPLFLFPRPIFYYFFGDKPFSFAIMFEWIIASFFTALIFGAVSWYFQYDSYRNSISRKTEKNH